MSIYRCAACGSPNVVTDTENGGVNYNYVKGAVGTVLLGAGGAAAGIQSKKEQVFKCPDCGLTLKEPMGFEIKTLIDMGVMSAAARKNLKLNGISIDWEVLTTKYKNIEKSSFDVQSETMQQANNTVSVTHNQVSEQEATIGSSEYKQLYAEALAKYEEDCENWRIEVERIKDLRVSKTTDAVNAAKDELANVREQAIQKHTQKRDDLVAKKQQAETKYQSLGVFKFSEKKTVKQEIEQLAQAIQTEISALSYSQTEYDEKMSELENSNGKLKASIRKGVEKELPLPLKPAKPDAMRRYNANGVENSAADYTTFFLQDEVFRFVEKNGASSFSEIRNGCETLSELSNQRINEFVRGLIESSDLREVNGKYYVKYGMSKAKAEAERAAKVESVLQSPEKRAIYELLQKFPDRLFTIEQIHEEAVLPADSTNQRVSACLRQLMSAELVERTEDSRRAYFKLAK